MNVNSNVLNEQNFNLAQNDDEMFDIYPPPPNPYQYNSIITPDWGDKYSPSPVPTSEKKSRRLIHREGDWHRSIQIWLVQKMINGSVRVLLQRRSEYKDTHPNMLDVSCAGHVNSGEGLVESALRELHEELGSICSTHYTIDDLKNSKAFIVTSSIKGETQKYGPFICNEYQDVFILWWKNNEVSIQPTLFAPMNKEEVAGFEVVDGCDLMRRMRAGDKSLVPFSSDYINALEKAFCLE